MNREIHENRVNKQRKFSNQSFNNELNCSCLSNENPKQINHFHTNFLNRSQKIQFSEEYIEISAKIK